MQYDEDYLTVGLFQADEMPSTPCYCLAGSFRAFLEIIHFEHFDSFETIVKNIFQRLLLKQDCTDKRTALYCAVFKISTVLPKLGPFARFGALNKTRKLNCR